MKIVELTGQRFGKLTVVKCLGGRQVGKRKFKFWLCMCDCGNTTEVRTAHLTSKTGTRSCGCLNPYYPLPEGEAAFNQIFSRYKRQAKQRNYSFELTEEEFRDLISSNCHYCDSLPESVQISKDSNGGFTYSGIDRIDSSLGYCVSNCVPCCKLCNWMKRDLPINQFLERVKKICIVASVL